MILVLNKHGEIISTEDWLHNPNTSAAIIFCSDESDEENLLTHIVSSAASKLVDGKLVVPPITNETRKALALRSEIFLLHLKPTKPNYPLLWKYDDDNATWNTMDKFGTWI